MITLVSSVWWVCRGAYCLCFWKILNGEQQKWPSLALWIFFLQKKLITEVDTTVKVFQQYHQSEKLQSSWFSSASCPAVSKHFITNRQCALWCFGLSTEDNSRLKDRVVELCFILKCIISSGLLLLVGHGCWIKHVREVSQREYAKVQRGKTITLPLSPVPSPFRVVLFSFHKETFSNFGASNL